MADQPVRPAYAGAENKMVGAIGELQYLRQRNLKNLGRDANGFVQDFLQIAFVERNRTETRDRVLPQLYT